MPQAFETFETQEQETLVTLTPSSLPPSPLFLAGNKQLTNDGSEVEDGPKSSTPRWSTPRRRTKTSADPQAKSATDQQNATNSSGISQPHRSSPSYTPSTSKSQLTQKPLALTNPPKPPPQKLPPHALAMSSANKTPQTEKRTTH